MQDIAIRSNRIITPDGIKKGVVLIKNGKIAEVLDDPIAIGLPAGDIQTEDVGDHVLMAGIVDPHVHINEPGRTEWEGFDTATKAAIAGGITSLIEMPLNASPVTTTVEAFERKLEAAGFGQTGTVRPKIHCNCGFWGGIIPGNEKDIEPLIEKGVLGFKAFLTHSGIDEFSNVTADDLRKAMPIIAKHGLPLLVHCELSNTTHHSPFTTHRYSDYLASRPKQWEDDAIALMIRLCEEFNCRTHIVHLSSADSIEQIIHAKEKGLPLTVETCQHYLYFNAEDIPDGRTEFKCAPPIREKENNEQLWDALKDGTIDFVATDHSPAPPEMKQLQSGDLMKAWGGISSIQFALPVLWTAAKKRDCSLTDIARWLYERPAVLPGIQNSKGRIQKGYDADLVIWNPEESFTVTENIIHHRHKITPYLGEELSGVVKQTWLAGEKVFDNGIFLKLSKGQILAAADPNTEKSTIFAHLFFMANPRKAAVGFIFITLLIDIMGWGLIIPVMPALISELKGIPVNEASPYGAWLVAAYAITQFFFGPIIGNLSDKYGRRPVLLASLFAFAVDYIFMALAPTYALLFVGRIISGITGASVTTASAYIADISTKENRAKNFGMIGAAFGIGFMAGPALGGLLAGFGLRAPFYAAAILCLLNAVYGYFVLPESLSIENRRHFHWKKINPFGGFVFLKKNPKIIGLAACYFLLYLGAQSVMANWSYFTMYQFGWKEKMVGISLGVVGLVVGIVQAGLTRVVNPKLGNEKSIYIGLFFYIIGLVLFAVASSTWMMMAFIIPYCMGGLAGPALQSTLTSHIPPNEQGALQGSLASLMSLTTIFGPIIMNNLFEYFTTDKAPFHFAGMPFMLGAALMLLALIVVQNVFQKERREATYKVH